MMTVQPRTAALIIALTAALSLSAGSLARAQGASAGAAGTANAQAETKKPAAAQPKKGAAAKPAPADVLPKVPEPTYPAEQSKIDSWKHKLDDIESALHAHFILDRRLDQLSDRASKVQSAADALIASASPHLEAAKERLKQIVPAPGAPPQSAAIKLERAKLQAEVTARQSIVQQAQLTSVRAKQVIDSISERRRTLFTDSILRRSQSLMNPSFWVTVGSSLPPVAESLSEIGNDWGELLSAEPLRAVAGPLIAFALLALYFFSPLRRWASRWTTRDPDLADPGTLRKTRAATLILLQNTAIPTVSMLIIYQTMTALGVLTPEAASLMRAFSFALIFVFFFYGLLVAMLAPKRRSWRLVEVEDATADRLVPIGAILALLAAIGFMLFTISRVTHAKLAVSIADQGVIGLASAILFMAALRVFVSSESEDDEGDEPHSARSAWRLLIPIGWILATLALLAPIVGYVTLGRFITGEMLVTLTILMTLVLLSRFADAVIIDGFGPKARVGHFARHTMGLRASSVRQLAVILSGITQLVLLGLAVFLMLATWGIQSSDLLSATTSNFFSFKIGNLTLSISAILGAIVVFIRGVLATKALQRWLDNRFLPQTNLDIGLRTSIRTGMGYAGVVLAAIVAFSIAGLNLQNLAIVAGALSVGIGFGLQSIVNNFVSGLILLVERPFKVGDRIEVGSRVGLVKRITVRATEITTFDNASVIVPNADLITGQVVNWMHGDFSGRMSVTVGTSYDSDPDQVIALLLAVANDHPKVLKHPEAFAIFSDFGADALGFTLYFYVGNIAVDYGTVNDVRLEVLKRLRAANIEIPFAQRDIHLRDLDQIERLVRDVAGSKKAARGSAPPQNQEQGKAPGGRSETEGGQ